MAQRPPAEVVRAFQQIAMKVKKNGGYATFRCPICSKPHKLYQKENGSGMEGDVCHLFQEASDWLNERAFEAYIKKAAMNDLHRKSDEMGL